MIYGYARVSTKGQARDGNSLEAQTQLLKDAGAKQIFYDSFTGTKVQRPEFDKLTSNLSSGDTLIVTKLDRFARSASQGSQMIESLINRGGNCTYSEPWCDGQYTYWKAHTKCHAFVCRI